VFAPTSTGSSSGTLTLGSDASNDASLGVPLSGTGESPPEPDISTSTSTLDFGIVTVGNSGSQTITIANVGSAPLSISALTLGGGNPGQFSLAENPAPLTLAPDAETTVTVIFAPTSEGAKAATLTIASDDPDEASVAVTLSGIGESLEPQAVTSFTLINADTNEDYDLLEDGMTYLMNELPLAITVRANTDPVVVGSVRFGLNEENNYAMESIAPYAIAGDDNGDYNEWPVAPGTYTLTATPYSGAGGTGMEGTAFTVTFTLEEATTAGEESATPTASEILPNAPNPFRDRTVIEFQLAESGPVTLEVYDVRGVRVATLVDDNLAVGIHSISFDASGLASGLYICRLITTHTVDTRKMLSVR
jgi:hypothetical protein